MQCRPTPPLAGRGNGEASPPHASWCQDQAPLRKQQGRGRGAAGDAGVGRARFVVVGEGFVAAVAGVRLGGRGWSTGVTRGLRRGRRVVDRGYAGLTPHPHPAGAPLCKGGKQT